MSWRARLARSAALLGGVLCALAAQAGELEKADVERRFQPPLRVGEKLREIPAWPISSELEPDAGPVGYVFESIDLAPIPGFEGTPFNLLIAIDRKGSYLDVEVLRQHEPVFLSGLGEAPLHDFVRQYAGKSLLQQISIASIYGTEQNKGDRSGNGPRVVLDGVTKATASIRIVNQTVLTAALAVARARLAFAAPTQHGPPAQAREDVFERLDFAALLKGGHVKRLTLRNRDIEQLFAGSEGAGEDAVGLAAPDEIAADFYVAWLNAPTIGRALLGDAKYATLMWRLQPGQQAYWVAAAGRLPLVDERFVRGTVPQRIALTQDQAPYEARDLDLDLAPPPGAPPFASVLALQVPPLSGLDPGQPAQFGLVFSRARGSILPLVTQRTATLAYAPPAGLFAYPPQALPDWLQAWKERMRDLLIIGAALVLLCVVLARPRWISISASRLRIFRLAFLAFTLGFIGWYAQGQLSVVQLTGALKALRAGQGLASFLYDPVSLLLIAFTVITFFVWGRATFCGWLCPFGALQEFVGLAARRLHLPRMLNIRIPPALAGRLEWGRYLVLAALVGAALFAPRQGESLNEIEPFKTAITVGFERSWPFVAYAAGLLLAGAFYYKFFCRFICPLGAVMSLGGRLRRFDWLPRRAECGKPCQSCKAKCAYDAIEATGEIRYDACFQCLDCVGIYHDAKRCAPILLYEKKGLVLTPRGVMNGGAKV